MLVYVSSFILDNFVQQNKILLNAIWSIQVRRAALTGFRAVVGDLSNFQNFIFQFAFALLEAFKANYFLIKKPSKTSCLK